MSSCSHGSGTVELTSLLETDPSISKFLFLGLPFPLSLFFAVFLGVLLGLALVQLVGLEVWSENGRFFNVDGRDFGLEGLDEGGDSLRLAFGVRDEPRASGVGGREGMLGMLMREACTLGSADVIGDSARW